jgi:hypothetical protein
LGKGANSKERASEMPRVSYENRTVQIEIIELSDSENEEMPNDDVKLETAHNAPTSVDASWEEQFQHSNLLRTSTTATITQDVAPNVVYAAPTALASTNPPFASTLHNFWSSIRCCQFSSPSNPKIQRLIKMYKLSQTGGTDNERVQALKMLRENLLKTQLSEDDVADMAEKSSKNTSGTSMALCMQFKGDKWESIRPCDLNLMEQFARCCENVFDVKCYTRGPKKTEHIHQQKDCKSMYVFYGLLGNAELASAAFCTLVEEAAQKTAICTVKRAGNLTSAQQSGKTRIYRTEFFWSIGDELERLTWIDHLQRKKWHFKYEDIRKTYSARTIAIALRGYADYFELNTTTVDPCEVSKSSAGIIGWSRYFDDLLDDNDNNDNNDNAIISFDALHVMNQHAKEAIDNEKSKLNLTKTKASKRSRDKEALQEGIRHAKTMKLPTQPTLT